MKHREKHQSDQQNRILHRSRLTYSFHHGIAASLWGSSAWTFNHSVALQTRARKDEEAHYWELTAKNLPCGDCTASFKKFQSKHPYYVESKQSKQLAYLFHETHNNVNKKNGKRLVRYDENVEKFLHLHPKIWLLALVDFLAACAVYQIDAETVVRLSKEDVQAKEFSHFTFTNLLPLHQLIIFLLKSSFLSSVEDTTGIVRNFIDSATKLLDPNLYNIAYLRRQNLPYLAFPFINKLEQIRNEVLPKASYYKMKHRVKVFLAAKNH